MVCLFVLTRFFLFTSSLSLFFCSFLFLAHWFEKMIWYDMMLLCQQITAFFLPLSFKHRYWIKWIADAYHASIKENSMKMSSHIKFKLNTHKCRLSDTLARTTRHGMGKLFFPLLAATLYALTQSVEKPSNFQMYLFIALRHTYIKRMWTYQSLQTIKMTRNMIFHFLLLLWIKAAALSFRMLHAKNKVLVSQSSITQLKLSHRYTNTAPK